jgi:hypothetical protein
MAFRRRILALSPGALVRLADSAANAVLTYGSDHAPEQAGRLLTASDVDRWLETRAKRLSTRTLGKFYQYLNQWGITSHWRC